MWPSQRLASIGLDLGSEKLGSEKGPTGNQAHRHATRRENTSLTAPWNLGHCRPPAHSTCPFWGRLQAKMALCLPSVGRRAGWWYRAR